VRDRFVSCVTKTSLFLGFFSTFVIFLWIVERIIVVADVNAHLVSHAQGQCTNFVTCVTNNNFLGYFQLISPFLKCFWIVEQLLIVADVNAHLVMYHMYRVSAPIT
jgi:hypothetical protein